MSGYGNLPGLIQNRPGATSVSKSAPTLWPNSLLSKSARFVSSAAKKLRRAVGYEFQGLSKSTWVSRKS
jgi:hypothetical protein